VIPVSLGSEKTTTSFFESMDYADEAIKSMTAMLNRYHTADVYIGVDKHGNPCGIDLNEYDVQSVQNIIKTMVNTQPTVRVTLHKTEEGDYIRIEATGYDIPYSFGKWFYVRRCSYERNDESGEIEPRWIQTITCGMKRHRAFF